MLSFARANTLDVLDVDRFKKLMNELINAGYVAMED